MKENKKTKIFPFWRFAIGTLIGGSAVCGALIFQFMQRNLNIPPIIFLFSYIGIGFVCVLPMLIAYMKDTQKKESVYWLSFFGVVLPFGPVLWLIGLIIAIFSKSKTNKTNKENIIAFSGFVFLTVLIEFGMGMVIQHTYEDSFILPKWEDRFSLKEQEQKCYFMATLGINKTRSQMDTEYRTCLQEAKDAKEKAQKQEKDRVNKLSKKEQAKEVFELCVNILKQDIKNYKVSKYDTAAQEKLRKNINYTNQISRELCQCASNLFVEKASKKEVVDFLFTYRPDSQNNLFFISDDMPFQICLKNKYNWETQRNINRALNIMHF